MNTRGPRHIEIVGTGGTVTRTPKEVRHTVIVHVAHSDVGDTGLGIVRSPLLDLRVKVMNVDCTPLLVADDHIRYAIGVRVRNLDRGNILRRVNRPALHLGSNVVGVNRVPRLRCD